MFWTIVGALIFVFFLIPIGLELGLRLLVALFEEDEVLGCNVESIADRKSTRLNSSHITRSRMPSSA